MPTLYVENVPETLYDSLRSLAKQHRRSMSAEVISLLEHHVPTPEDLARRREVLEFSRRILAKQTPPPPGTPTVVDMIREIREDRDR